MPLFFFRSTPPKENRERAKNALASGLFLFGGFSYIPHGKTRQKWRKIERERQTTTRATRQHSTRRKNKPIKAHQTTQPTDNTTHGTNAPKKPEKGQHAKRPQNAHGGRAERSTKTAPPSQRRHTTRGTRDRQQDRRRRARDPTAELRLPQPDLTRQPPRLSRCRQPRNCRRTVGDFPKTVGGKTVGGL